MAIIRWDPFRELAVVQDRMNRLFEDAWGGRTRRPDEDFVSGSWMPSVDVRETKDALELNIEVPGIEPKDVTVGVENGVLTIKGSRNFEKASEGETYHRIERAYGTFERSFTLPSNVDTERIQARYRHGVLELTVPKREEAKPKSISIKVEEK
jgi:HSP20 family protein